MRRADGRWALSWQDPQRRRCGWCGRYLRIGAEAGHGWGLAFCEACHLAQERRRATVWALSRGRGAVATGAAC